VLVLLAAQLALAAPAPAATGAPAKPPAVTDIISYRGEDGSEHFVGSLEDVPTAQRRQAHKVDLSGWSTNPSLAEGMRQAKEDEIRRMTPTFAELAEAKLIAAEQAHHLHPGKLTSSQWFPIVALAVILLMIQAAFFGWVVFHRPKSAWLLIPTFLAVIAAVGCGFYLWSRPGVDFPPELNPFEAEANARRVREEVNRIQQEREGFIEKSLQETGATRSGAAPKPSP
jgi:hypothetical protein